MTKIKVTSIREVGRILDFVHDRIFQLSDIRFDKESGRLSVPITVVSDSIEEHRRRIFFSTWVNPIVESELIVWGVTEYRIEDGAQVGEAMINTINVENDCLILNCSMPVKVIAKIERVDLEFILSNKVVGKVSRFSFSSPSLSGHH